MSPKNARLNSQVNEKANNDHGVFSISNVEFKDENEEKESSQNKEEVTEKLSNLSLRQRKPAHDTLEKEGMETTSEKETTEKIEPKSSSKPKKAKQVKKKIDRNPLHWFGILVPSSLRTSQQHFKTGNKGICNHLPLAAFLMISPIVVTQIVEEANLVNRLSTLEERFEELQKEKERILCEMSDSAEKLSQPCVEVKGNLESNNYASEHEGECENEQDQVVPEINASDIA